MTEELQLFDINVFEKLTASKTKNVTGIVLYYLSSARNAWHSTWISRYKEGCMHIDLADAKRSASLQRKQGTVFTIRELPALCFHSNEGLLVITEINNKSPLSEYSPNIVIPTSTANFLRSLKLNNTFFGDKNNHMTAGTRIGAIATSFDHRSSFWITKPNPKNSILIFGTKNKDLKLTQLTTSIPSSWISKPTKYSGLAWDRVKIWNDSSTKPIKKIILGFKKKKHTKKKAELKVSDQSLGSKESG